MIFFSFLWVFGGHLTLCNISFAKGGHKKKLNCRQDRGIMFFEMLALVFFPMIPGNYHGIFFLKKSSRPLLVKALATSITGVRLCAQLPLMWALILVKAHLPWSLFLAGCTACDKDVVKGLKNLWNIWNAGKKGKKIEGRSACPTRREPMKYSACKWLSNNKIKKRQCFYWARRKITYRFFSFFNF